MILDVFGSPPLNYDLPFKTASPCTEMEKEFTQVPMGVRIFC